MISERLQQYSRLYCRYNGFMLGLTFGAAYFSALRGRYSKVRRRMQEFLDEIEAGISIPSRHKDFVKEHDQLGVDILNATHRASATLRDFFFLGFGAHMIGLGRDEPEGKLMRARVKPLLGTYGMDAKAYDRLVRDANRKYKKAATDDILNPAYDVMLSAIAGLRVEQKTCFVIMPFSKPFADYYAQFYRPALCRAGYRAIRAWEGLAGEQYFSFLVGLIGKCGAALADLSKEERSGAANVNVIHEVGIARGLGKVTFLIGQRGNCEPPGNLAQLAIGMYSPKRKDWPEAQIEESALAFLLQLAAPSLLARADSRSDKG